MLIYFKSRYGFYTRFWSGGRGSPLMVLLSVLSLIAFVFFNKEYSFFLFVKLGAFNYLQVLNYRDMGTQNQKRKEKKDPGVIQIQVSIEIVRTNIIIQLQSYHIIPVFSLITQKAKFIYFPF